MRLKRILTTTFLASILTLGMGLFVANNNKTEAKPVGAASTLSGGQNLFLKVDNTNWSSNGAAFALYCFDDSTSKNAWAWFDSATDLSYGYSVATVPSGSWPSLIIVRMNPNGSDSSNNYLNWNNKWNQTDNIGFAGKDTYTITGTDWDGASHTDEVFSEKCSYNVSHSDQTDGTWTTTSTQTLFYRNDSEGAQFYNTNVNLSTGMKFDVVRSTDSAWFHSDYLENGGAVGTYFKKNGTNDASVEKGGTFEFYVKVKNNTVWTQVSSVTEADTYAEEFLSTIACKSSGGVDFDKSVWNKVGEATTSMEYKYEHLTSGARNYLTGLTPNQSGSKSEQCVARYDRILGKYGYGEGSDEYHDFMKRTPAPQGSARLVFGQISNNNAAIIVVVVSMIGVASLAGYYFFKKRKHERD